MIYELEIMHLETRNLEFVSLKFRVSKLKISSFLTQFSSFYTQNLEFVNLNQENWSQNAVFLRTYLKQLIVNIVKCCIK